MAIEQNKNNLKTLILNIKELLFFLAKKWWIFLLSGILGGVIGIMYAYLKKAQYESTVSFALESTAGGLNGAISLAAEFGLNIGMGSNGIFEGDNIFNIIKSKRIIEAALLSNKEGGKEEKLYIEEFLEIFPPSIEYLEKKYPGEGKNVKKYSENLQKGTTTKLQDSILHATYELILRKILTTKKPDKRANYYLVQVKSPSQEFSISFLNKIMKLTTTYYTELKTKRSLNTLKILEERSESIKGNAKAAIDKRAGIQDANMNPAFNSQSASIQRTQIEISAFTGAYGELFKNLEIARYQYLRDIPLLEIIDHAEYPAKKIKPGRLMAGIIFGMILGIISLFILIILFNINKQLKNED